MVEAIILITQKPDTGDTVYQELEKIPEVTQIFPVYGIYDYIMKVEAENLVELNELVGYGIRRVEDIDSTLTMIVTNSEN